LDVAIAQVKPDCRILDQDRHAAEKHCNDGIRVYPPRMINATLGDLPASLAWRKQTIMRSKRPIGAALFAVASLLLSGCGALSGDSGTANNGPLEKIKVAELKLVDAVPVRMAIAEGHFKAEGLEVELSTGAKGSVNIDNVLGGSIDIGMSSYPPAIAAHVKAKPLVVVADAVETKPDSIVLVVKKDSQIKSVQELAGKKIANSSVKGISEMAMNAQFKMLGVDYTKIKYVSAQIADMPSMVTRGDVDAAIIAEPHVQVAYKEGTQKLYDPFVGRTGNFPWSGLVASREWVDSHRETAAKFQRAIAKGAVDALNKRDKVIDILKNDVGISEDVAQLVTLPTYPTAVDPTRLQRVVDLMKENGEKGPNGAPLEVDMKTMVINLT
jgi:NitT/TauT family transport system substrate-binding protein